MGRIVMTVQDTKQRRMTTEQYIGGQGLRGVGGASGEEEGISAHLRGGNYRTRIQDGCPNLRPE